MIGLRELRLWAPGVTNEGLHALEDLSDLELLDLEGTNIRGSAQAAQAVGTDSNISRLGPGPKMTT